MNRQEQAMIPHDKAADVDANLYVEWRAFYTEKVRSWMSLEELRTGCGRLHTVDAPSVELLLVHAMHALEERERRDEALRRQAAAGLPWDLTHA